MGGVSSGRTTDKRLVEECLSLDLANLMPAGKTADDGTITGSVAWPTDWAPIASVKFRLDLRSARLALIFRLRLSDGKSREIWQTVALTSTMQNFGGRRWWLRCPVTGNRARKLYLPSGADQFASRKAWNLGYRVERLSHFDRPFEKMFRAQRKLGGEQGLAAGLTRPKGMWRRTFARRLADIAELDAQCGETIAAMIADCR